MQRKDVKFFQVAFVTLLVGLVTVSLVPSPGTQDVDMWQRWAYNADTLGMASGFEANKDNYPPYSSVILLCALRAARLFRIGTSGDVFVHFTSMIFYIVKLSILFFLLLTSLVFWWWTRDFWITVLLHLSLLLSSVALGYIDVFFAPSLLLSMWALKEQKLVLFTAFYSIACLTKWQPIIIAPFLGVYLLNMRHVRSWKQIDFKRLAGRVLVPTLAILMLTFAAFGVGPVLRSLKDATSHDFLSGNALNFNWILTHWLHVFSPERFGGLIKGQAKFIRTRSLHITLAPQLLFLLSYASVIVSFFRRDKTFEVLLNFALMGYLAYFIFNTGVHENHLFLATLLSFILFWTNRDHLFLVISLILMSNVNLFVFYGIDGRALRFTRVIANTVDIALLLSILHVSFFMVLWSVNVLQQFPVSDKAQ